MAGQKQGPQEDSSLASIIYGILLALMIAVGLWMWGRSWLIPLGLTVRYYELSVVGLVSATARSYAEQIGSFSGGALSFDDFSRIMKMTGNYTRWLFVPVIAGALWWVMSSSPRSRYQKRHSMKSLIADQAELWPEIMPIVGKDLVTGDIRKGPYAVSLTEREFVQKFGLINDNDTFNQEKAKGVFIRQLGPKWKGVNRLPAHAQAVFALCCLRLEGKGEEALQKARLLASSYAETGTLDVSWVAEVIRKHGKNEFVVKAIARHAYVFTVFCMLLQLCQRSDGIMPSSWFTAWLKPVDRRLFYALNGVGRYSFFVEDAGIKSHWLAEKSCRCRIEVPCVESAVAGLAEALEEFCEDDSLERIYD